jgi:mRNA interferase HigB
MRIISEKKLRKFWQHHPESESVMREWIKTVKSADWNNFSDVRETFNHADIYGGCTIFDAGGNKYWIIGKIAYQIKVVFIRFVLTHREHDEKKWQSDCKLRGKANDIQS